MAILKDVKKELKKEETIKSAPTPVGMKDDSFTAKDRAIMDLAKRVIYGVLGIVAGLVILLFILTLVNSQNVSLFKDIRSTFIAVASGIVGSILGYYYKNND